MILVIGNKTYSSWSLRPWVLMKHFGIPFEEKLVKLDRPDTAQQIAQYSRAGKVPILVDGDRVLGFIGYHGIFESRSFLEKTCGPRK